MIRYLTYLLITAVALMVPYTAAAQEDSTKKDSATVEEKVTNLKGQVDGIDEDYQATKATVEGLAKLKISGYIQSQFQLGDTSGISTSKAGGGSFGAGVQSRFMVRRGRLKTVFDNSFSQYALQIDVTNTGFAIKEAYVALKEPWLKTFTLSSGVLMRPFGYELPLSSGDRESPEMSRIVQTLFPGEYELGTIIGIAAPDGPLSMFNISAGAFNGTNPSFATYENDDNKDAIGRIGVKIPIRDIGLALDGGFSAYVGKVKNTNAAEYEMTGGNFVKNTGTINVNYLRQYLGGDAQLYYDVPYIGGAILRGEIMGGKNPGDSASNPYIPASAGAAIGPLYERNMVGGYFNYIQNIGTPLQFVFKIDWFDPNTDLDGSKVDSAYFANAVNKAAFNTGDLTWTTYGVGLIYNWDGNVKFLAYYDMPRNELLTNIPATSSLAKYKNDLTDNVFTFRVQYKF